FGEKDPQFRGETPPISGDESIINHQEPEIYKTARKIYPAGFNLFFDYFPAKRRGNKDQAFDAWQDALNRATQKEIIDGLSRYSASNEVHTGWAKSARNWLEQDGWATDYTAPELRHGSMAQKPGAAKDDKLRDRVNETSRRIDDIAM